jgi:hypothetical protein
MLKVKQNIARFICTLSVFLITSNVLLNASVIGKHTKYHYLEYVKHNKKQIKDDKGLEEINITCDLTKDPFDAETTFTYIEFCTPKIQFFTTKQKVVVSECYLDYLPNFKENPLWIMNRQIRI